MAMNKLLTPLIEEINKKKNKSSGKKQEKKTPKSKNGKGALVDTLKQELRYLSYIKAVKVDPKNKFNQADQAKR